MEIKRAVKGLEEEIQPVYLAKHPSGIVPTLQNIVSTVNLDCKLGLRAIALKARNAAYNPKHFAAVIMRIREPKTTALIFASGKMVCTYHQHTSFIVIQHTPSSPLPAHPSGIVPTLQNIVSTVNLDCKLGLRAIALKARNAAYNPKHFAAVIMRIREPKTTALIFASGKMVCTCIHQHTSFIVIQHTPIISITSSSFWNRAYTTNIVSTVNLDCKLGLRAIALKARNAAYNPKHFAAVIMRIREPKTTALIFASGKMHPSGIVPTLQNIVSTVNLDCKLGLRAIALKARNAAYNPKHFAAVIMRIREPKTTALIFASGKMHPSGIVPTLQNIVSTVNLDCKLGLRAIALKARNAAYNPKHFAAVIMRIREPKTTALIFASGKMHPSGIVPTLQNIVSTVNLDCKLGLRAIALKARNAAYNPKHFAAVIMRIREPKTTALIFASGKMVCTYIHQHTSFIHPSGIVPTLQNIVSTVNLDCKLGLRAIDLKARNAAYNPKHFAAVIMRIREPKTTALIFASGKMHPSGIVPTLQNIVSTVNLDCKLGLRAIDLKARNAAYNPKHFAAVIMRIREPKTTALIFASGKMHPSGIVPTLQNIVSTVNLDCKLGLRAIALKARNAAYNPKHFAAVIMRIREPKTTALIFASGKMHPSGIVPTLQNIVSTVNLDCKLGLRAIALKARNAAYNPKHFAAVIMRIREPKTTALIFASGKMVCTCIHQHTSFIVIQHTPIISITS
ncbi:hypothetical protein C5167_026707, partial [Papaver somniferum]